MSDREWPWVKYDGLDSSRWVRLEDADKKVDELEAQHKRELVAARDAVEFWQNALDKSEERLAELEAEVKRYHRIVPGTPAADSEWVALVNRTEQAEARLKAVKTKVPVYVTSGLKRNPQQLGHDDQGWMKTDDVLAALGGDEV